MSAQQLVLLPREEPRRPVPLPPPITAEAVLCMAELLLQVATSKREEVCRSPARERGTAVV